ncbi:hypothetical protein AMTRI_Chr06g169640 [Amborella trichopoda]
MRVFRNGDCLETATQRSSSHNVAVEELSITLPSKLEDFKYIFFDQFQFLRVRAEEPRKYGKGTHIYLKEKYTKR